MLRLLLILKHHPPQSYLLFHAHCYDDDDASFALLQSNVESIEDALENMTDIG